MHSGQHNNSTANAVAEGKRPGRHVLGYLLAGACLAWVLHDIDMQKFWRNMAAVSWWWIFPALVCDVVSYVCQGLRWQMLLRYYGSITTLQATKAIYAGLFINEILPLRLGELVRAYIVARWLGIRFVAALPSIIIERLFDALWLGAGIGITAIVVKVPDALMKSADNLGLAVLAATGLLLYLILFRRQKTNNAPGTRHITWKPLRLLVLFFRYLADQIHELGRSRFFYLSLAASSLILLLQVLAFWFVMLAYGMKLSVWIGTAVLLLLHLGTILPNAPSNVGTYQLLCVAGLMFFGVDKTVAASFSMVVFILLTVPLWAIGMIAIARCGMSMREIRNEAARLMQKKPAGI